MSIPAIGLYIIGDEILSGRRDDQHMAQIIQLLKERGLQLAWVHYLTDQLATQADAYQRTANTNQIVFSCGGIGATPDDHTRQAAAIAFERPLVRHPEAEAIITERIVEMAAQGKVPSDISHPDNQFRLRMADIPQGAILIENPVNRFPGFSVDHHHFVPGFPAMAWPMITNVLDRQYTAYFHQSNHIERSIRIFQLTESQIINLMEHIESAHSSIRTFSLPFLGNAVEPPHIEFGIKGPEELVNRLWDDIKQQLQRLGASF